MQDTESTREEGRHLTPGEDRRSQRELAKAFTAHRAALARALYEALKDADDSAESLPAQFAEVHEWWQAVLGTAIDLASEWLRAPDMFREDLFSGWISRLNHPSIRPGVAKEFSVGRILEHTKPRWEKVLEGHISVQAAQRLDKELARLIEPLLRPIRNRLRVLVIGDCLMTEIMASAAGPCLQSQIALDPVYRYYGMHSVLRNEIRELAQNSVDLVFFSPFSYTFVPEYDQLLRWSSGWWPRTKFFGVLDGMLEEVATTVRLLAEQFACPIYVHNAAGVVQTFGWWPGVAKNLMSMRNRVQARNFIGQRMERLAADAAFEGRVRMIDEEALRRRASDFALGRVLFRGDVYHPTLLSMELARGSYMEAIAPVALLEKKKVVVCDLDNTLWEGVIGEGPVKHLVARQRVLKGLRNKGVLLAINSKNDAANVDFSGGVLGMDDFAAARINWEPKAPNMASIVEELNLKEKDFVFIDDRLDELERVQNVFPAMTVLNAADEATWAWLAHWEKHLRADELEDRTKLYRERAAREQFLSRSSEKRAGLEDEAAALRSLQLALKIEQATRAGELKRAVELVNRTNQFNLDGSRVTMAEVERGLGAEQWVMTAAARDKFGSMGVVGTMIVRRIAEGLEIPVFVLSCRVFGFGIEYALLNAVGELAGPGCRLVARYKETPHNVPCREFYAKAGLRREENGWVGTIGDLKATPAWLTIEGLAKDRV